MKKTLSVFSILVLSLSAINAQSLSDLLNSSKSTYKISGTIINAKESDTLVLGYYRTTLTSSGTFAKDTAVIQNNKVIFSDKDSLSEGMYFIFDKATTSKIIPLIIDKQKLKFECDMNDIENTLKFINSPINTTASNYQKFLQSKSKLRKEIEENNEGDDSTESINKKNAEIASEVNKYINRIILENSDNFFGMFLKTLQQPIIPDSIQDSSKKSANFYKSHYWYNFNLQDERILNTSHFYDVLNTYFEKWTHKHPDSIISSINTITELTKSNKEMFKFMVEFSFYKYDNDWKKIMGMDKILVHMADNYIQQNLCEWIDSTRKSIILERAEKISPNLIGRKASDFLDPLGRPFMKDTLGIFHTLQEINADYTVLVFFGPTCGHCKKEIPKIKHDIDSLVSVGYDIKTFAVATEFDKKEWKKFINNQKTGDWLNVADIRHDNEGNPVASSDWRDKYDIYSTPVIYLLDKDKKIIAKRITHTQIVEIISRLEGN